jgi:hypothetical protein
MLQSTLDIQELREGRIEDTSRDNYLNKTVSFMLWLYKYEPANEVIATVDGDEGAIQQQILEVYLCPLHPVFKTFMDGLDGNQSDAKLKKKIKAHIREHPNNPPPLVDFNVLTEIHFVRYVISLRKSDGEIPQFSSYNSHRSGFKYLYSLFRQRQTEEMGEELAIYFKSLRKRSADGKMIHY